MELETTIKEAILALAPKFKITPEQLATFRLPTIEVCDNIIFGDIVSNFAGSYNWEKAHFKITQISITNPRLIGHEVGHYLHHELNPSVVKDKKKESVESSKFWQGEILIELVAEYAGIIYATGNNQSFSLSKNLFYDNLISGLSARLSDVAHEIGTRRAEKAFQESGETLLPKIARMGIDEAEESLPRILPITLYERRILPLVDYLRG
ncbi:hypothetical protein HYU21_02950 [Candidatus Woesearchaeota archaeon]|nr:hypothetical protein [Candidatus Woesearchaeota archaeon]